MNPEIRFRVSPEIHQLAELPLSYRAQQMGTDRGEKRLRHQGGPEARPIVAWRTRGPARIRAVTEETRRLLEDHHANSTDILNHWRLS